MTLACEPNAADRCAGQRGNINYRPWFEALGISQRVTKHQSTLCVGVEDFNGFARH